MLSDFQRLLGVGSRRSGLAALACAAIVVGLEFYSPLAVIEGSPIGVSILRNSELRAAGGGSKLWAGDRLKSPAESSATIHYLREASQIKLQPGTQLRLDRDANGNRLELITGAIAAKVAPQPAEHPMLIATPHSDVKVLGTEFLLSVDAVSTHVEVIEGAVEICSREDGKAVKVNRDQFANVAHGVELAARSLLPAPWNSQDIGAVGMTGYARIDGHQCKIKAAGKADAKSKDQFHFLYQVLEGDGEIRARVVDLELTHDLAKAGILIRNSLKPASPQAFLYLKAKSGMEFEHRGPEMRKIVRAGRELAPYWLRLVKSGDSIKAFKSADGVNWVPIGTEQIVADAYRLSGEPWPEAQRDAAWITPKRLARLRTTSRHAAHPEPCRGPGHLSDGGGPKLDPFQGKGAVKERANVWHGQSSARSAVHLVREMRKEQVMSAGTHQPRHSRRATPAA
jgi:hypothetical protein